MEQPFELMTSICALAGRSPTEVSRAQLIELMHVLMVILTRGPREWGEAAVVVSEAGPSGQMLLKLNVNAAENVRQLMEHRGVDAMLDHTLWCVEHLLRDGEEEVEADGGGEVDEDDDPFGDTGGGGGGGSGGVNHSPTTSDGSGEQARELALSMLRVLSVAGETFPSLLSELSQATALRPLALLLLVAAGGTVSTIINELGDANPDVHLRQRPVDSDLAAHLLNVLLPTLDQNPLAFPQLGATGIFELLLLLMCSIASDGSAEEGENSGICVLACSILQLCHRWRSNGDIAATTGTPPSYLAFFLPFELVALLDGNSVKFARIFCAQTPALQPDLIWGPQQRSHLVDVLCTRLQLDFVMHDEIEPGFEIDEYNTFVTDNAARQGVVYVGANDGMLHGFNDDTGAELIAYVPSAVYENLDNLASSDYAHTYFVDAAPNIIDVFLDNANDPASSANGLWRTVLIGGLNGGGQQIYALDVTDPSSFDEANADDIVLWEFDDSDDADLGYTYSRPQIAKMADGTWAAIFGNGYNNTEFDGNTSLTGHGVLFIVDVETGETLKKIDTNSGLVGTPNGLATPLLIDSDGDSIVDYIYAGDLLGNLWKFDVTESNPNEWKVAGGATPRPLFTTDAGQPITSQPQATMHPDNLQGFMIFVGSGKYLESNDNDGFSQTTQSFYGIWDQNDVSYTTMTSDSLLSQSITNQFAQSFDTDNSGSNDEDLMLREVSDNLIDWGVHLGWVLDLQPVKVEDVANSSNFGERQVSNAVVRNGRVIFTTLTPSPATCEFGGTSFLMQLDFRDGSALEFPAFDLNGDGEFDTDDTDASGRASDVGIMPTVSILADSPQDVAFGSGASGDIDVIRLNVGSEAYGRQSWRQLD
jgi:hypothetical protein